MHYLKTLIASILIASAGCTNPPSNALTTLNANPIAPDFILQDIDGSQHAFSDYRGKVVVINFWATWCPPCISEMPSLERASIKLAKQGIPILGIDVGEDRKTVMQFLRTTPVSFTVLLDIQSEVLGSWAVPSLPATIVINQEGKMALLAVGAREWDSPEILQQIISLQKTY